MKLESRLSRHASYIYIFFYLFIQVLARGEVDMESMRSLMLA